MRLGNLHHQLVALLKTDEPARLGPERRAGTLKAEEIDDQLTHVFQELGSTRGVQNLLKAAIYIWHDHLDAAHLLAQEIESDDGSLLHGIVHRREPDYSNARYWFRRVGSHPSYLALALGASEILARSGEGDLQSRLLPNKTWDPFAFVDEVQDVGRGEFRSRTRLLEEIQKIEIAAFVENVANRAARG
jgi:hypothetical protein